MNFKNKKEKRKTLRQTTKKIELEDKKMTGLTVQQNYNISKHRLEKNSQKKAF